MIPREELTYDYANARLKAMKTKLIGRNELFKLASIPSMDDLVSSLEKTDYRQELVNLSIMYHGADLVDRALGMNIARVYSKVVSMTPQQALDVVNAFTGRWNVHNLQTILFGKHLGHDSELIEKLIVPAGNLDKKLLARLIAQDSVEKVVYSLAGTVYGPVLVHLLKQYAESGDISLLTSALERFYYKTLSCSVRHKGSDWDMLSSLVRFEIDSKNVITLMRHVQAESEPFDLESALIKGGEIELKTILKLRKADIPGIVSALRRKIELSRPLQLFEKDQSLVHFEVELENRLYSMGLKAFRLATLSIGPMVGFLYLKETEAGNLRKIVRGVEFNIGQDKIKENLVVM